MSTFTHDLMIWRNLVASEMLVSEETTRMGSRSTTPFPRVVVLLQRIQSAEAEPRAMGDPSQSSKAGLGIVGLDDILFGGLRRNRMFLVEGSPGAGKTTLGLQYLLEGARLGEKGLYITLSESEAELKETIVSHGWSLGDGVDIFELAPPES